MKKVLLMLSLVAATSMVALAHGDEKKSCCSKDGAKKEAEAKSCCSKDGAKKATLKEKAKTEKAEAAKKEAAPKK